MQLESNLWLDEDKAHDFIVDMLVDFGILYGEELIADARSLRGTKENAYLSHGVKNFYIVAQNNTQNIIKWFKESILNIVDDPYNNNEPLYREKRMAARILGIIQDFDRYCHRSLVILSREKNTKELQRLLIKEKKRLEAVLEIFKLNGLMPTNITLSTDMKLSTFGSLVDTELGVNESDQIVSNFAANYFGGVFFDSNRWIDSVFPYSLLCSKDFMERWGGYVVVDLIFKRLNGYENILKVSKEVGYQYSHIKEQTLKVTSNILSPQDYEREMISLQQTYKKSINSIEDLLYNFSDKAKRIGSMEFQTDIRAKVRKLYTGIEGFCSSGVNYTDEIDNELVKQNIDFDESWRQEEERLLEENCPCFWYIKRETERSLVEIHKETLDKTNYALSKIRSFVPKDKLHTFRVEELSVLDTRDKDEFENCIYFLNRFRILIFELMSNITQQELTIYVNEVIRKTIKERVAVLFLGRMKLLYGEVFETYFSYYVSIVKRSNVKTSSEGAVWCPLTLAYVDRVCRFFFTSESFSKSIKSSKKNDEQIEEYKFRLFLKSEVLRSIFSKAFKNCGFCFIKNSQGGLHNIFITGVENSINTKEHKFEVAIYAKLLRNDLELIKPYFKDFDLLSLTVNYLATKEIT